MGTHEGGISTPLIVSWPDGIAARGEWRRTPGHVVDLVPTLLGLAGIRAPHESGGAEVPPKPGKDLASVFAEDKRIERDSLWWFHDGHRAIRIADWKLVAAKDEPWELYDLSKDRAEANDLSSAETQRVSAMQSEWDRQLDEARRLAIGELAP